MEKKWRGDVVGQIADGAKVRPENGKVEAQYIGIKHREIRCGKTCAQCFGEIVINFHRVQMIERNTERRGDRTGTRADFDQDIVTPRCDGGDDATDVMMIGQKMLAEPFLGAWQHGYRLRANCTAKWIAAIMLPVSMLPVPARSSAVPWSTDVRMIGSPSVTFTPSPKLANLRTGKP